MKVFERLRAWLVWHRFITSPYQCSNCGDGLVDKPGLNCNYCHYN